MVKVHRTATSDEVKIEILENNPLVWEEEVGDEVRAFLLDRWPVWEQTKPKFFTTAWKSNLPNEYLPPRVLSGQGGENEKDVVQQTSDRILCAR